MGLFSNRSSSTQQTTYDTTTTTVQSDQSGNSGLNFAQTGDLTLDLADRSTNTIVQTDQGAIESAARTARESLAFAGGALGDVLGYASSVGAQSIGAAQAANAAGLSFGASAVKSIADSNSNALSLFANVVGQSIDASRGLARDAADANAAATKEAIAGFSSLAKQTSASSDDRVSKVAGYALAAVAAAIILPAIFGRRGLAA